MMNGARAGCQRFEVSWRPRARRVRGFCIARAWSGIKPGMQMIGMVRHGSCVATRRRLNDLCDRELAPPLEARVRRHLAGCRRCRRAHARLEATIADVGRLRSAAALPDVPDLGDRVRRRITDDPIDDAGRTGGA